MSTDRGALGAMKALDLALNNSNDKPIACCPRCQEPTPLICTMVWPGTEWCCLECGGHYGFLSPIQARPTPELEARYETLKAEWDEHAGLKLRMVRGWFDDCEQCKPMREYHCEHASDGEREADQAARKWLANRVRA